MLVILLSLIILVFLALIFKQVFVCLFFVLWRFFLDLILVSKIVLEHVLHVILNIGTFCFLVSS